MFFITVGLSSNCYSVYQPYFRDSFSLTESKLAFMNTSRQIAGIIAMAVIGIYYRNISLKWGMIAAAVMSTSGYVMLACSRNYVMLVLACLLTGFGNNFGGMIPISMLLDRWFAKDRSLAVSICSASSGVATFVAPKLITGSIARYGLSITLAGQAFVMLLFTLLCAVLIYEYPQKKHLVRFGEGEDSIPGPGETSQDILRQEPAPLPNCIWILVFFMVFLMGGLSGCAIASLPLLAKSQGYSDSIMANAVSLAGFALLAGKLLYGWLCERISQYRVTMIYGIIMILGLILLCVSAAGKMILYAGSILYIGTLAMIAIGLVTWAIDWVRQSDWVRYRSRWMLTFNVGCLVFSIVPGILADRFNGSYLPAFYILLGEAIVCLIIIFLTYRAARR